MCDIVTRMCGRFAIFSKPEDYLAQANMQGQVTPCQPVVYYNAHPSLNLPAIYRDPAGALRCDLLHWGLIPSWAKDRSIGFKTSNARSETAAEKPSFRQAFSHRRCIVPVDGWYEWFREGKHKQPYFHHRQDKRVIWIAGLWERWVNPEDRKPILSFTLLTRDAVGGAAKIHDRMPVILDTDKFGQWLDPELKDRTRIESLMRIGPEEEYEIYPVNVRMNSPKYLGADCVDRVGVGDDG